METKIIRSLIVLGVPGVALGVFYLLLRTLNFQFAQIDAGWAAIIAILFVLVIGGITAFALHLWRPTNGKTGSSNDPKVMVLEMGEETVTLTELIRSVAHDVVKVDAHTHTLGVGAEYEWKKRRYPGNQMILQQLVEMDLGKSKSGKKGRKKFFDVLKIKLSDGRTKEIYFDISSFFNGAGSSMLDPDSFIAGKIRNLYRDGD